MRVDIVIEGKGGQGVQTLGRIVRQAVVNANSLLYVAVAPEYDTVVRGGVSNCHILIAGEEMNPVLEQPDFRLRLCDNTIVLKTGGVLGMSSRVYSGMKERQVGFALVGLLAARGGLLAGQDAFEKAIGSAFANPQLAHVSIQAFQDGFFFES